MKRYIKILHILQDDKFLDGAIETFEETSATNTYVLIDTVRPFRFIKRNAALVQTMSKVELIPFVINNRYDIVAFHTLTTEKYDLVMQIPSYVKILWLSWGFDLYHSNGVLPAILPMNLYKPLTKQYVKLCDSKPISKRLKSYIKKLFFLKNKQIRKNNKKAIDLQKAVISRIDYMSTVLPSEYDALQKIPYFKAEYFYFQYVSKNNMQCEWIDPTANCILIGNSATETNNHLDVIKVIKNRDILNVCMLPCSYGDEKYLQYLEAKTNNDVNIHIVKDFLPIDEYKMLLRSCRVAVFGHIRQQSLGNIVFSMLQGSKVFLYKDSIAYKYFQKGGFIVFSIEDDLSIDSINQLLTEEERLINVCKLKEVFSYSNVVERLENMLLKISE